MYAPAASSCRLLTSSRTTECHTLCKCQAERNGKVCIVCQGVFLGSGTACPSLRTSGKHRKRNTAATRHLSQKEPAESSHNRVGGTRRVVEQQPQRRRSGLLVVIISQGAFVPATRRQRDHQTIFERTSSNFYIAVNRYSREVIHLGEITHVATQQPTSSCLA